MDKTHRRDQYPLLGEPQLMFEGDNVYVIHEKAEIGKVYSFKCPHCHSLFISKTMDDEVMKIKCPECETYICFSSRGEEGGPAKRRTQIIAESDFSTREGILVWNKDGQIRSQVLLPGEIVIGRADPNEPSDISIEDYTASRRSVKITVTKGEQSGKYNFKLTVLRTTNAVYVNNNALYAKSSIYLNYGDNFKVGETVFTLIAKDN